MMNIRVYTINFQYDNEGNISNVLVDFRTANDGGGSANYMGGTIVLTFEEFSAGTIAETVRLKIIELLTTEEAT